MKIDSPYRIELLLHFHCRPNPPEWAGSELYSKTVQEFLDAEVIEEVDGSEHNYATTALGAAWVQALCEVEVPRVAYVDKHGTILSDPSIDAKQ